MEENNIVIEKKKSNTGLIIVIVILLLIIFGLGGFIFINKDKLFSTKTEETTNEIDNKNEKLSEEEALKIGNELWDYAAKAYWGSEKIYKSHYDSATQTTVCDTSIDTVKAKFSSDFKAIDLNNYEYTLDSFMHCTGANRGSHQLYNDTKLEIKEIKKDEIVFNAISSFCTTMFCMGYDGVPNEIDESKEVVKDFIIVKENDQWVIKFFYLPN